MKKSDTLWTWVWCWVGMVGGVAGTLVEAVMPIYQHDSSIWAYAVGNAVGTYLGILGYRKREEDPRQAGYLMVTAAATGALTGFQWYALGFIGFVVAGILLMRGSKPAASR